MVDSSPAAQEHAASAPGSAALGSRMLQQLRSAWAGRRQAAAGRGAGWVERAAATARSLVRPRILRQAVAAARRGNLDAAFALLREEVGERPGRPESILLFWGVALSCERAPEAAPAMARLVHDEAAAGRAAAAADHWLALVAEVPAAAVDVATLARIVPVLRSRVAAAPGELGRQQARERLVDALRRCVDPANGTLPPGLALRIVEDARGLDVEVARAAARVALASSSLHEAKRTRLTELLRSLDAGQWPEPPPAPPPAVARPPAPPPAPVRAPSPPPARPPAPPAAEPVARAAAPAPLLAATPKRVESRPAAPAAAPAAPARAPVGAPGPYRVTEITPVELEAEGLVAWEIANEQRTRVHYRAIEALAAAEVAGLAEAPVIVVDLLLRTTRPGRPRSALRMRADAFDAAKLFPDRTDAGQALRALLAELLDRSGAIPLPDPDSALGLRPQRYESLAAFETAMAARLAG